MKRVFRYWKGFRLLAATALAVVGGMTAAPEQALAASYPGQFHVFGISSSGNLFQDTYQTAWTGWQSIGNDGEPLTGTPAIAYDSDNGTYHAYAVGRTSGNVYQATYAPGSGWYWDDLGGTVQGGVSATYANGSFHVFAISPSGNLFQDTYASGWSGWQLVGNHGEALTGSPAVAYDPDNGTYHVYAVGQSGTVYQATYSSGWYWDSLGGTVQGGLGATYANGMFHVLAITSSGNLFQDTYLNGWSGWALLGNPGQALTGSPGVAYDPDNGSLHVYARSASTGATWQDTFATSSGWFWDNLGGTLQGGLNATYVSANLGQNIAAIAMGQVGYTESPMGTNCNKFTYHWGQGGTTGCDPGTRSESWCADFASWVWQQAGVSFTYGTGYGELNAEAASFYGYGTAHGTWHPAGSGYTPQPGDAVVYGLDNSGGWAAHVAIVTGYTAGNAGPNVVNGNFSDAVTTGTNQTTNGGGYGISGYASP